MSKPFRFFTLTFVFTILITTNFTLALAQDPPPPPPPPPPPSINYDVSKAVISDDSVSKKVPGATVRGRVVYEDSGLPMRYGLVGLTTTNQVNRYSTTNYVRTDENGEFVLEDVKAGDYFPYFQNDGILNPDAYKTLNRFDPDSIKPEDVYQKISVNGQGQFQVFVRAKRGSSFSGIVRYFDGEAAVGVKVEALRQIGGKFLAYPVGTAKTDDRGYYRFAGLPEGTYTMRVIEPVSHKNEQYSSYSRNFGGGGLFKTYYPQAQMAKEANGFDLINGQEQTAIDVTLPDRQLFDISGQVVLKRTGEQLKNFNVDFTLITEETDEGLTFGSNSFLSDIKTGLSSHSESDIPSDWTLRNLPKGKYKITATQRSYYGEKAEKQIKYPDVSQEIEITDANLENVVIEIPTSATIKGIVVSESGKPLSPYLSIFAQNLTAKTYESSGIDYSDRKKEKVTQTEFVIEKLTEGKIKLGYGGRDFYVRSISVGGRELTDQTLELKEGQIISGVRVVLASDLGILKGKVNNFDATKSVRVLLMKSGVLFDLVNEDTYSDIVKKDGTYEVKAKEGEYKVVVLTRDNMPKTREGLVEFVNNALENAQTVTINKNKTTQANLDMPN